MKHGSLFSGIGGFDLAAQWMGWENIFQVEKDPWCQRVLEKNFPKAKRYGDIKEFDGTQYRGAIDILTGGFPCQPYSLAGKRKGDADERHLWPEFNRIIGELRPLVVVGENVSGLLNWNGGVVFEEVKTDLENQGYEVTSFIIPAAGVGAWHRRDRVWIVAHAIDILHAVRMDTGPNQREARGSQTEYTQARQTSLRERVRSESPASHSPDADANSAGCEELNPADFAAKSGLYPRQTYSGRVYWETEPGVGRVADGIPHRVDRIKGLGNAIVPQVAFEIFKAIEKTLTS